MNKLRLITVLIVLMGMLLSAPIYSFESPCDLSVSKVNQTKCLLRSISNKGHNEVNREFLPEILIDILTDTEVPDKIKFKKYLDKVSINEFEIGGSLDDPLSTTKGKPKEQKMAEYLVIHDTSWPNMKNKPFPKNMNDNNWKFNKFETWGKPVHVFINRVGNSYTKRNFSKSWRATKFENKSKKRKGLFLHVELVQPRVENVEESEKKSLAPVPGFTDEQLRRLAVVYIAASIRKGSWLIPTFHGVLDAGIPKAHDDPKNFDLYKWTDFLEEILTELDSDEIICDEYLERLLAEDDGFAHSIKCLPMNVN